MSDLMASSSNGTCRVWLGNWCACWVGFWCRVMVSGAWSFEVRNGTQFTLNKSDSTLSSVGLGAEFQIRSNVSLKMDWGFALEDVRDGATDVTAGDSRVHVSFTFLY